MLADGRLVLMTPDEEVDELGDVLSAPVGEEPDALGDRHLGRVRLTLEVVDRHQRRSNEGTASAGEPPDERGWAPSPEQVGSG